ncbi:MAG: leucine--tRNA ligase [Candidatus Paceibacterota bacterium]
MKGEYNHKQIEKKWQKQWDKDNLYRAKDFSQKKKFYALIEFPFPSGEGLHTGHIRSNTAMDIIARKRRMEGFNVLYPVGWDAFGLPTENYAIKTGIHPAKVTKKNTDNFRRQLKALGFSFDWEREIDTSDPQYYKWTQWIFIQLFKQGLAYKAKQVINWCPACKIGLANEEVVDGVCERCGEPVGLKEKEQWMLAITKYADRLDRDLAKVDYLEKIKLQQKNWIGKSRGALIDFPLKSLDQKIQVFTTRPETIFGATFLAVAPEKLLTLTDDFSPEVKRYIEKTKQEQLKRDYKTEVPKTGIKTGLLAINPASGEELPVWVTNYVLSEVGTGAIMAVPAHDDRDFDFAKKYNLPIKEVIDADNNLVASGEFSGLSNKQAGKAIVKKIKGKWHTTYKLRDWVFSRQRYWGEPIPLVHCSGCGWQAVPEKDLPVKLPNLKNYQPTDSGESPLAGAKGWLKAKCPKCAGPARRETDTMPNWAGSSWYFLRYADPGNDKALASARKLKYWQPVDWYNGGMEHTTLHLLYSRFWHKFLFDIGVTPDDEPYRKRTSHGMILGAGGIKMSKSKGNVVNPDTIAEAYGADTLRVYEMFMGPFEAAIAWDEKSIIGSRRFLEKVWQLQNKIGQDDGRHEALIHRTIKKVSDDIETMSFNTAISAMMILVNHLEEQTAISRANYQILLRLLAPFAPFITEELWVGSGSIHRQKWPEYDKRKTMKTEVTVAVQINGKVRDQLTVATGTTEAEIKAKVLARPVVIKWLAGRPPRRVIYVQDKLVSLVV